MVKPHLAAVQACHRAACPVGAPALCLQRWLAAQLGWPLASPLHSCGLAQHAIATHLCQRRRHHLLCLLCLRPAHHSSARAMLQPQPSQLLHPRLPAYTRRQQQHHHHHSPWRKHPVLPGSQVPLLRRKARGLCTQYKQQTRALALVLQQVLQQVHPTHRMSAVRPWRLLHVLYANQERRRRRCACWIGCVLE